jgi:hypothetical protein
MELLRVHVVPLAIAAATGSAVMSYNVLQLYCEGKISNVVKPH